MYGDRKSWKFSAKGALSGRWGTLIIAQVIVSAINLVAGNLTTMLFPGYDGMSLILSQVFSFLVSLVMCIFTAGLYYMYLNVARGKEYSYKNLIYFFKNQPDKIIVASFVMAAIAWLTSSGRLLYLCDRSGNNAGAADGCNADISYDFAWRNYFKYASYDSSYADILYSGRRKCRRL